ncbi:MAG: hypothetical protein HQM10_25690 [Candidatus Riflebacteria bacterium]|nr:hypothetical protein [Candidatus Riflebacteria bacterium]
MSDKPGVKFNVSLIIGLVVFLLCFGIAMIFWDQHHEKELSRSIDHYKLMAQLHPKPEAATANVMPAAGQLNMQPARRQIRVVDPLRSNSSWPYWGIQMLTITSQNQRDFASPVPFGVVILQVSPDSFFNALQPGDIMVKVDDMLLKDEAMFWSIMQGKIRGTRLNISLFRCGVLYALHFDP